MKTKVLLIWILITGSVFADNVVVTNLSTQPVPVKVLNNFANPSTAARPGATPSPSPAMAVVVQGIAGATAIPVTIATPAPLPTGTTVKSSALEASHVLKASAGSLVSVAGSSNTDQWILIMDSATVPANGAVTLLYPPIHITAGGNFHLTFPVPLSAANGIAICNSNANSFTKTLGSADCIFAAQVQ